MTSTTSFRNVHELCRLGDLETLRPLAAFKDWIESRDQDAATPLYCAAEEGHLDVVVYLVKECKANVNNPRLGVVGNVTNNDGATPLLIACRKGWTEIVQFLIDCGADVSKAKDSGGTPLYIACQQSHIHLADRLLAAGADVNQPRNDGATPLFISSQEGHLPVVEWLINRGAEVNLPRLSGSTPLFIACQNGHLDVVKHLVTVGKANVNWQRTDGATPLLLASFQGHEEVAEFLLLCGASPELSMRSSVSPFLIACQQGQLRIAQLLAAHLKDVGKEMQVALVQRLVLESASIDNWLARVKYWNRLQIAADARLEKVVRQLLLNGQMDPFKIPSGTPALTRICQTQSDYPGSLPENDKITKMVRQAMSPWSPRTQMWFPRETIEPVITLLCVAKRLKNDYYNGRTNLPPLPMEMWMHICSFIHRDFIVSDGGAQPRGVRRRSSRLRWLYRVLTGKGSNSGTRSSTDSAALSLTPS